MVIESSEVFQLLDSYSEKQKGMMVNVPDDKPSDSFRLYQARIKAVEEIKDHITKEISRRQND